MSRCSAMGPSQPAGTRIRSRLRAGQIIRGIFRASRTSRHCLSIGEWKPLTMTGPSRFVCLAKSYVFRITAPLQRDEQIRASFSRERSSTLPITKSAPGLSPGGHRYRTDGYRSCPSGRTAMRIAPRRCLLYRSTSAICPVRRKRPHNYYIPEWKFPNTRLHRRCTARRETCYFEQHHRSSSSTGEWP